MNKINELMTQRADLVDFDDICETAEDNSYRISVLIEPDIEESDDGTIQR